MTEPSHGADAVFTLDAKTLALRRAASAKWIHTVQIPVIRAAGFVILCFIAVLQDLRVGEPFPPPQLGLLVVANLAYASASWFALRHGYGRTGGVDLSLVFMHLDVLAWLPNLRHLEQSHLFFAYLLLVRVADQVGFGFRRALYFNHVVLAMYLGYAAWVSVYRPADAHWAERLSIAAIMYLLGSYLASTGVVIERLRNRLRQSVRTARGLVESLEQQKRVLEAQAAELDAARREAEQANVAKSQFLATISHEIRTPMNGVLGTTELLLGTPLGERQRQFAETTHRSALALLTLIDDVLDLSRLEASRLTLKPTLIDLRALITEAVELMAATIRDKPVVLRCELPTRLPAQLEGDPLRLRQLLVNLLHNAIKFTERGSVVLEVTILEETTDSMHLYFSVQDTGIGIAEDKIDSVFDAFTQADASSTRRHGGSGLGLTIVKELTELMGGETGVESRLGEGSMFWVALRFAKLVGAPAPQSTAVPLQQPQQAFTGAAVTAIPGPAKRVLLAEDDRINQMVVEAMLRQLGCTVEIVGDGEAACEAAAAAVYDLIVMDCHMPVVDGWEATRRIREREFRQRSKRHVPIVALTADALAGDRERCLAAGMDDYLTKPISIARLSAAVERWATSATLL